MYPLGLASVVMFFLIFYAYRETAKKRFVPFALVEGLTNKVANLEIEEAKENLRTQDTVMSRAMIGALGKIRPDRHNANRGKVEITLVENLEAEENAIMQWINYLNVVAAVAPMIGLLGTVSGMISAFQTLAAGGMGRPELLAGNIGEALITTATGLVIGIPAMIAFFVMRNRLNNNMIATAQAASDILDGLPDEIEYAE